MKRNRKELEKIWWHIYDKAFAGTGFTKRNSRFMSANNSISPGTIFDISKNIFGRITDGNAIMTYKSFIRDYPMFPRRTDDETPEPCQFTIKCEKENDIEMATQLLEVAALSDLNLKGGLSIQNGMELIVKIDKWGIDFIEELPLLEFLESLALKDPSRYSRLHDGDNYVATKGIWVEGISIEIATSHSHKWSVTPELKTALKKSPHAEISIKEESSRSLQFSTKLKHRNYPFLRLRSIEDRKRSISGDLADKLLETPELYLAGIRPDLEESIDSWTQGIDPEMFV
jgi:hypothetical protein